MDVTEEVKKNEKKTSSPTTEAYRPPSSVGGRRRTNRHVFVDQLEKRKLVSLSVEDIMNLYQPPEFPECLKDVKNVNPTPFAPFFQTPLTDQELAAAWDRATDGKTEGKLPTVIHPKVTTNPQSVAAPSEPSKAPSQSVADEVLQSMLQHSQAVSEREELNERKKANARRSPPSEPPRRSPPSTSSMYHITKSLDPSLVLQQSCANHHIAISPESLDDLLTSYKQEPTLDDAVWTYIDLQGFEQGPFPSSTMRAWFEQGFLTSSLMIRYLDGPWRPLRLYFRSLSDAFLTLPQVEGRKTAGGPETQKRMPKTVAQVLRKRENEKITAGKEGEERNAANADAMAETNVETNVETKVETEKGSEKWNSPIPAASENKPIPAKSKKPVRTNLPIEVNYSHSSRPRESHVHQSIETTHLPDAISLQDALSLQTQQQVAELNETPPAPVVLAVDPKQIPALTLQRDAKIVKEKPSPVVAEKPREPAPKPTVNPWTKKPLTAMPSVSASASESYLQRIGSAVETEKPSDETPSRGSVWGPPRVHNAISLTSLLESEREAVKMKKMEGKSEKMEGKSEKKKGNTQWKPLNLESTLAPQKATIPANVPSFEEIQREQMREKEQRMKEKREVRGGWASVLNQNVVPKITVKKEKVATPKEETFLEVAKKKAQQQERSARQDKQNQGAEFEEWCKQQMMVLYGSDDISLLEFCRDLADDQILLYLQDLLGSSKRVLEFGREFIKRKNTWN